MIFLFIIRCECGAEIYCANEIMRSAWQCDECGKWYDSCGYPVKEPEDAEDYKDLNCMAMDIISF